ncbi:MAG TPA: SDR family NAD(P)-dependent oxidoreductase [Vicinamibacterales bacterium]|nr:SDR family NAD(P)-dependent oxidoreductase [Vicinamibacterales bacterium]
MNDKVIVIAGASAGIGAALADTLARKGARLVLAARRKGQLADLASRCGAGTVPMVADMTRREDVKKVVAETVARFGHIDVWINNVGRGISRLPSELTDEDIDLMMLINVKSALYGMQEVLPHFKSRGQGQVINISSMLGRVPFALVRSAYSASKHFLNSLTANFRTEVQATHPGIQITLISPGVVATDFGLNALYGGVDSRTIPGAQSAEEVAEVIAGAIESREADVYTRSDGREMVVKYYAGE